MSDETPKKKPLEAFVEFLDAGANTAEALGAERAARVGRKAVAIAREAPRAARAIEEQTRPTRRAAKEFWDSLVREGWAGNREPRAYGRIAEARARDGDEEKKKP